MKNCSTSLVIACMHDKSLQLCPTLIRFPIHGILQARILEWVAMTSSRYSSPPRDQTHISCVSYIGRWVLYHSRHLGPLHFTLITSLKPCRPLDAAVKNPPTNAGDARDVGLIPGWGRSPGGGQGNPLQYSCLENPVDRGVRQLTVPHSPRTHLPDSVWPHQPL